MDVGHVVYFPSQQYPFLVETQPCLDWECSCQEIGLTLREMLPPSGHPRDGLIFTMRICLRTWQECDPPPRSLEVESLVREFLARFPGCRVQELCAEFEQARASQRQFESIALDDSPDTLVSFAQVTGDGRTVREGNVASCFFFVFEGREFLVEDQYCANPQCDCRSVHLEFWERVPQFRPKYSIQINAERKEKIHRLRKDQKMCPHCDAALTITLVKGCLRWAYRPAKIFGIQHLLERGFCNCCHCHVVTADAPPEMIDKGAADASLLAHLTTSKQGDHLPLYRYEEISLRHGWWIPRSTQAGWLYQTSLTAVLLYAWLASRVLNGRLINTDATGTPVLEPGSGQVQKGTVWVYCGQPGVCPYMIYDYSRTGEGEAPRRFLEGYQGYLQADAASVFDRLYAQGTIYEVACGAHMRRYFYKARFTAPLEAHRALLYFRQLYMLERALADKTNEQRRAARRELALPILAEFKSWLDEQSDAVVPKTEIADAVRYSLNQWSAFERYCDEGWLLIDNTRSERALRPIAIGRRNWLFFGSDGGGRTGTILFSLVASCKANRVHPYRYLEDVYRRLPKIREHASLLPILREACKEVVMHDGTRPNLESLCRPLDYLRILKDHSRPLIEQFCKESSLDPSIRDELDNLLPDRWLAEHLTARLEINRRLRLVGEKEDAA